MIPRCFLLLPLLAVTVCQPAKAAPLPEPDPAAQCRALLALAPDWQVTAKTVTALGEDGCEFGAFTMNLSSFQGYAVERLRVTGLDFKHPDVMGAPFIHMRLEASGIKRSQSRAGPSMDYAMMLIQRPLALTLAVDIDAKAGTFHLTTLDITGKGFGHFQLSAELTGVSSLAFTEDGIDPPPTVGLRAVHLHFDNETAFESYVALPLAIALLGDDTDPAGGLARHIASLKTQLTQHLHRFGADAASVSAALAFVDAFPHPDKTLDITLDAASPLVSDDFSDAVLKPGAPSRLPPGALVIRYGE